MYLLAGNAVTKGTPVLEASGSTSADKLINCSHTGASCIFQKWHYKISGPIWLSQTLATCVKSLFSSPWIWRLRDRFKWWKAAEAIPGWHGFCLALSQDASLGTQPRLHRGDKNALKRLNQSLRYELPSDDEWMSLQVIPTPSLWLSPAKSHIMDQRDKLSQCTPSRRVWV